MTPESYFNDIVLPNVAEFRESPSDIRRALNSAITLHHLSDIYCASRGIPKELGTFRKKIDEKCNGQYKILRAVANCAKHYELTVKERPAMTLTDIKKQKEPPFSDGTYFSDGTAWTDSPDIVVVNLNDDTAVSLLAVIESVVAFWQDWLGSAEHRNR